MTEQEWLAQSDDEKNKWIVENIFGAEYFEEELFQGTLKPDFLSWQGFGLIVEKFDYYQLNVLSIDKFCFIADDNRGIDDWVGEAATPWEAAALAYGKMKGLIDG